MKVKQLYLALPEGAGQLAILAATLAGHGINIVTLDYLENCETGAAIRLRLLVNDPDNARDLLAAKGFVVTVEEVVVVEIPDMPGALAMLMQIIDAQGLAFFGLHVFAHRSGALALVEIAFHEPDKAALSLARSGVKVLSNDELLAR